MAVAKSRAAAEKCSTLKAFCGDKRYRGMAVEFAESTLGLKPHISTKIKDGLAVLPMRRIVERTFASLGNYRRLSKGYAVLFQRAENMVRIAMLHIRLNKCV